MIAAVAALAIGGTVAYFYDTETSTGNTISTGTIDINVNGGTWKEQAPYALNDMKPGYTDYINFKINNVGSNPANVWKKLSDFKTARNERNTDTVANLEDAIVYDLSVKVYAQGGESPLWFQTIYTDADGKTLSEIYGGETGDGVLLGMIPAKGYMEVEQSYTMESTNDDNKYQGETMTFDMRLFAEQLTNTVTMVHKTGSDWDDIDQDSNANAVLTYKVKDADFKYDLSVAGLAVNTNYVLVTGTNPYSGTDTSAIRSFTTDGTGSFSVSGQAIDLNNSVENAKVWVILASDWNETNMTGWHGASYLFETAMIDYYDTDL